MKLSVAYPFEPGMIERLSELPEVYEIYGKMDRDVLVVVALLIPCVMSLDVN